MVLKQNIQHLIVEFDTDTLKTCYFITRRRGDLQEGYYYVQNTERMIAFYCVSCSSFLKNTTFRKLALFSPSYEQKLICQTLSESYSQIVICSPQYLPNQLSNFFKIGTRMTSVETTMCIHSSCSQSYDKSVGSTKASSPQSAGQYLVFQTPVSSLFLNVIQQLLTSSFSSSRHFYPTFYLSFNNVFQKVVPTHKFKFIAVSSSNMVAVYKFCKVDNTIHHFALIISSIQ